MKCQIVVYDVREKDSKYVIEYTMKINAEGYEHKVVANACVGKRGTFKQSLKSYFPNTQIIVSKRVAKKLSK